MPSDRRELTRADLPDEFTPDSIRRLPIATLSRLARPGNGILAAEEQASYDAALHELMSATAGRVSQRINRSDWASVVRDANDPRRATGARGRPDRTDEQLRRLARRIGQQVDIAEGLAPGVDWSFAQPGQLAPAPDPATAPPKAPEPSGASAGTQLPESTGADADPDSDTISDLEQRLNDQVELVQVMSEIADVSKRAYALEQQRELQNTRGIFFGFVVSVAVLVAGWAPIVAADDWAERFWIIGLSLGTCVVAAAVYALVRKWQNDHDTDTNLDTDTDTDTDPDGAA